MSQIATFHKLLGNTVYHTFLHARQKSELKDFVCNTNLSLKLRKQTITSSFQNNEIREDIFTFLFAKHYNIWKLSTTVLLNSMIHDTTCIVVAYQCCIHTRSMHYIMKFIDKE